MRMPLPDICLFEAARLSALSGDRPFSRINALIEGRCAAVIRSTTEEALTWYAEHAGRFGKPGRYEGAGNARVARTRDQYRHNSSAERASGTGWAGSGSSFATAGPPGPVFLHVRQIGIAGLGDGAAENVVLADVHALSRKAT